VAASALAIALVKASHPAPRSDAWSSSFEIELAQRNSAGGKQHNFQFAELTHGKTPRVCHNEKRALKMMTVLRLSD
jgi:hypothetical protein